MFDPSRASLDTWILLIARGLAIDLLRRRALETKKQRSTVALSYLGERSEAEVAELEGIPRGTAKGRTRAGIARLRHVLAEGGTGRSATGLRDERVGPL